MMWRQRRLNRPEWSLRKLSVRLSPLVARRANGFGLFN
jgi:hypothetical protein